MFVDLAKREVTIPTLFNTHHKDFGETDQDILMWLFQFLCTKKRLELALVLGTVSCLLFIFIETQKVATVKYEDLLIENGLVIAHKAI